MKFPDDLEIPLNTVQQIQISHNFTQDYIKFAEKNWNSISYHNEERELIIVLVLDKYDDPNDYVLVLDEFNKELEKNKDELDIKSMLETILNFSKNVFRARDEVMAKLSNEVAELKMREYDLEKKFEIIIKTDFLPVRSKILFLLAINEQLTFDEIKKDIKTSKKWVEENIKTLKNNKIISYDVDKKTYFINF